MKKIFRSIKPFSIAMSTLLLSVNLAGCIVTDFPEGNIKKSSLNTVTKSSFNTLTIANEVSSETIASNSNIDDELLADIQRKAIGYGKIVETTYVDIDDSTVQIFLERNLVIITKINDDNCEVYYYGSTLTIPLSSVELLPSDYEPNFCYYGDWVGFD